MPATRPRCPPSQRSSQSGTDASAASLTDPAAGWWSRFPNDARCRPRPFMRRAIALARQSAIVDRTGSPFGCVIVRDGEIVGEGVNQVPTERSHRPMPRSLPSVTRARRWAPTFWPVAPRTRPASRARCATPPRGGRGSRPSTTRPCRDALEYGDFDDESIYEAVARPGPDRPLPARERREEMPEV